MEELPDVAEEFIEPILPCLDLLKNGNILLYKVDKSFWKKYCHLSLNMVCLAMYLRHVFRGELKLNEMAYVVSVYVVSMQAVLKATVVILKKKEIRTIVWKMGSMWRAEDLTEVQINKKNALLKRLKLFYAVFYWINMIGSMQYSPLYWKLFSANLFYNRNVGCYSHFLVAFRLILRGTGQDISEYIFLRLTAVSGALLLLENYCPLGTLDLLLRCFLFLCPIIDARCFGVWSYVQSTFYLV